MIGLVAAAAIWLCLAVGMASIVRPARPETALRFAPFDGGAKARMAELELIEMSRRRGSAANAERLARAAIERDPTLVAAWRTLALAMELRGARREAARLFHFTERLSRRDAATQLWLIEERVAANDISGALRHYDIALRTSSGSASVLLPILVAATSEPAVIRPLAALLLTNPPWRNELFVQFSRGVPAPDNLAVLVETLARRQPLSRPDTLNTVVSRMVQDGQYGAAWRIARLLRRYGPGESLLRNGAFDTVENPSPFDWRFESSAELAAEPFIVEGAGQGSVLVVRAAAGNGGSVARQLLALPPGAYRIEAQVGQVPGTAPARLHWNVTCAEDSANILGQSAPRLPAERDALRLDFTVPSGRCGAQWLVLGVRQGEDTEEVAAWTDRATILRRNTGSGG